MLTSQLLWPILALTGPAPEADCGAQTLVHDAVIHTASDRQAVADAMVFDQCGKILAVGDHSSLAETYPSARSLSLSGKTVIPGFIDAHAHVMGLGQSLMTADLMDSQSVSEVLERLNIFSKTLPEDAWVTGRGWDQNNWDGQAFPSRQQLDVLFPNTPVWLRRVDGHAAWANTAAMKAADRDFSGTWQVDGGQIIRDDTGQATGVFIDQAMGLIESHVPAPDEKFITQALNRAISTMLGVGLTGVHEAGTALEWFHLYQQYNDAGALPLRLYVMANGDGAMLERLCTEGHYEADNHRLVARSVKLYMDGALGSRGAALLEPYSDQPGHMGLLLTEPEVFESLVKRAAACKLQVNTHAIGDRGNRVVLDGYEKGLGASVTEGRHRIEHSQVVALEDFKRFKSMGLIASVQPTHATSDMDWAEQRVGPERVQGAYAWQRFIALGVPLALGSDFPVERPDPLLGFYAAVSRQDTSASPEGGWYPDQRLTRLQALKGFTIDAAFAGFMETITGSLEVGKQADFVVLSKDIMTVPSAEILQTQVLQTWVDGQQMYLQTEAR